ncbi:MULTISPECIES: type III secretion protein [unclassified Pseudomonas]|uniref:type III secretion protein n=1 Tax=unclassified Pseudomonas TaxID=196821 RepID=UPI00091E4E33|nr:MULTISPECIES: type III secretion protein [unclassified Pseudomonas]SFY41205.1 hypothetical protein SAMN03159316_0185 [Pseudomonas sp. NFR02]
MTIEGVLPSGRPLPPDKPAVHSTTSSAAIHPEAWHQPPSSTSGEGSRKPFLLRGTLSALRHRDLQNFPLGRASGTPPGASSTDNQLAKALEKSFGLLHSFLNDGRLTWMSLQRIAVHPMGESEALDGVIQVVGEMLKRPRLSDAIFSRDGDITRDSLRAAAQALQGNSSATEFSQDPFHAQGNAQVVEALQSQFPLLRDKAMDRTYLFEPHQYVEIARLREVMQDPHEVDQQGAPVLDASTGMPQSKYSELCVYTAKNIIERPGLLPSLERANGTRLFGPPHKEGWLSNKSLERWHEQDAARKAR